MSVELYGLEKCSTCDKARAWLDQHKTPDSVSVKQIIDLTRGAYGAEAFRVFFENIAAGKVQP